MKRYDRFLFGFIPGMILPIIFIWLYLSRLYPGYVSFTETVKVLFPSALFAKILMLSIVPDIALMFFFYKSDSFKIAMGVFGSMFFYLIASIFMF